MMEPEERYLRDPQFRQFVDMLEHMIREAKMTGTEIREAAILAAIHHENTRIRRYYILKDNGGSILPYEPGEPGPMGGGA